MKVRSPKSGFVIQLFVKDQEHVALLGSPLLQMDSDAEDRYMSHLKILEKMRELKTSQYIGPEVEVTLSWAQVAVEISRPSARRTKAMFIAIMPRSLTRASVTSRNTHQPKVRLSKRDGNMQERKANNRD